ncbi:aminotransferase class I/II-fold pyridoxal phosphate-dependent enzyme [bacterium]|nr:aminotransferase class I/II-fold pyridoxal phosphate-dependent enzyme [bacterium]MBU1073015.1 aminotransferase class I/II-fold pyridoxal phosphate-dependent enzyme [bacterium]MBU1676873.1 aminotransferase class I/II-fold pyridoxal phosphate-dependent enzyme [bacterium]
MSRLDKLPPYLFTEIDRAKREAVAAGRDVIDLGIGDPDLPTPGPLLDVMSAAVRRAANHRYPDNRGAPAFREAVAAWLDRRQGVDVDPQTQVLALIGSKEGLAHLPLALLAEGEGVLVPDIGYPVYAAATLLAGGLPAPYRLRLARAFLPDPAEIEELADARTRLLLVNSPHNPTGAVASAADFAALLAVGERTGLVVANDAAYREVVLSGAPAAGLLQVADLDRDRVIEFHSFSKMFNMTGWRIGFAVGHAEVISALGRVKQNIDSGAFTAVQETAIFALSESGDELMPSVMRPYARRREVIAASLAAAGLEVFDARATFYVWARVPAGEDSFSFCRRVLAERDIVVTPGTGFGGGGEGWFRISLTSADDRIDEAAARLRRL